jgi:polysaccharide biosynthesis/export protein
MHKLNGNRLHKMLPIVFGLLCLTPAVAIAQELPTLSENAPSTMPIEGVPIEGVPIERPSADTGLPSLPTLSNTRPNSNGSIPANNPNAPVTDAAAASSYPLGPGDRIEVSVYGFEEYTGPLSVLPDGTITLPLVGKVPAAGRTTDQLTQDLTVVLDRILVNPYVSITLSSLRPVVINVSGEVYRPGPLQIQGSTEIANAGTGAYAPPSVSEALVQAGGVTRTANIRDVVVMRSLPNGETARIKVNLWDALWSETLPEDTLLRDGDLVFVPRLEAGEIADSRLLARSSLAPETVRVRVVGEVTRPGEVPVPPNSSLSSAVAIAGGPTDDARLSEVAFIRMNDAGEIEQELVDLSSLVDTYQVQDGDVVVVPKTTSGSALDFAQRLLGPLGFLFGLF